MLKLYGVPLSQPYRSVAWACLWKKVPFEASMIVPGSSVKKMGGRSEEYLAKNPLGTIPFVEDGDLGIAESPAILQHLAQKHGWTDLYPSDPPTRTRVDSFMHWHHGGTRQLASGFVVPYFRPDLAAKLGEEGVSKAKNASLGHLKVFESAWLAKGDYVAGSQPTLADLIAYEEVAQLSPRFLNLLDFAEFPRTEAWLARMAALPAHDEAPAISNTSAHRPA